MTATRVQSDHLFEVKFVTCKATRSLAALRLGVTLQLHLQKRHGSAETKKETAAFLEPKILTALVRRLKNRKQHRLCMDVRMFAAQ